MGLPTIGESPQDRRYAHWLSSAKSRFYDTRTAAESWPRSTSEISVLGSSSQAWHTACSTRQEAILPKRNATGLPYISVTMGRQARAVTTPGSTSCIITFQRQWFLTVLSIKNPAIFLLLCLRALPLSAVLLHCCIDRTNQAFCFPAQLLPSSALATPTHQPNRRPRHLHSGGDP